MIKLDKICKTYYLGEEEVRAVCDVSLEIKDKEYVSLMGSSGSGKSTLMYIIGLLEVPSAGKLFIDNKDTSKLDDDQLSTLRNESIGFVFQSFNLINKFTVLENILLPFQYIKKKLNYDPNKYAQEIMTKFGIWERKDFYPNKISGGQQQRVAIARALMMKPKVILADEPTGNLDTKTGNDILKIIGNLNKEFGTTVIIVTHEADVAKKAKRQIKITDGKIIK
jgi:putative ABC transport system ATP-binding protein